MCVYNAVKMVTRCSILLLLYCLVQTRLTTGLCTKNTDCFKTSVLSSTSLVQCVDSKCVCKTECFHLNSTSGQCYLPESPCYAYSSSDDVCHSSAPSWLTAVLLSLLLGTTGADNFYINRFEFAIPQLLLFLSPLCGCFALFAYSACAMILYTKRNLRNISNCINLTALILASLAAIIFPLTTISWNIADLLLFSFNRRHDSRDCILQA